MPKVSLDIESFKALASETRLDILRVLDGKKMNLSEITKATKLHKMTLHEHLTKLTAAGFIKKIEREGHKWVYYKLSWKGQGLLHPENTRIVVMFSMTFFTLIFGIFAFISYISQQPVSYARETLNMDSGASKSFTSVGDPFFMYLTIIIMTIFFVLLTVSIWRYKKNRPQKL
jgi:DNA-binding transcriptional ArsR family regulator